MTQTLYACGDNATCREAAFDGWGHDLSAESEIIVYPTSSNIYCTLKDTDTGNPTLAPFAHNDSTTYAGVNSVYEIRIKGHATNAAAQNHTESTPLVLTAPLDLDVGATLLCEMRSRFVKTSDPDSISLDVCAWSAEWHELATSTRTVQGFPLERMDHNDPNLLHACGHSSADPMIVKLTGVNFVKGEAVDMLFYAEKTGQTSWDQFGKNQVRINSESGDQVGRMLQAPSPSFTVSAGPCTASGLCFQSPNYPSNYGRSQECTIKANTEGTLEAVSYTHLTLPTIYSV